MPHDFIGVNGVARKIVGAYVGVNGVARKVKKAYVGVNGVAKRIYPRLPDAYQEVEYLYGNGTPYINTGLTAADIDEYAYSFKKPYAKYGAVFGNYVSEDSDVVRAIFTASENNGMYLYLNTKASGGSLSSTLNIDYDNFNEVSVSIDSTTITGTTNGATKTRSIVHGNENLTNIALFHTRCSVSASNASYIKYFIFKKNGKEVRNFVPCYRKSDNVAGMYDVANDVFYTNAGNGAFTVGSDV